MPSIWLMILYFLVKSIFWKKFLLYFGFIFLLITSLPIISTYVGKYFYNDKYIVSNQNKKPIYILIPTAGIWYDGFENWYPTRESIRRVQYGKKMSEKFSIPLILAGGGNKKGNEATIISEYFDYDFYLIETESKNTFEMAKNLKTLIEISDGPLLLVTNPLHNKRTILSLKKQNFDVLIPDNYLKYVNSSNLIIPSFRGKNSIIPSLQGFNRFNSIIYEFLGIIWYYFTGKI